MYKVRITYTKSKEAAYIPEKDLKKVLEKLTSWWSEFWIYKIIVRFLTFYIRFAFEKYIFYFSNERKEFVCLFYGNSSFYASVF